MWAISEECAHARVPSAPLSHLHFCHVGITLMKQDRWPPTARRGIPCDVAPNRDRKSLGVAAAPCWCFVALRFSADTRQKGLAMLISSGMAFGPVTLATSQECELNWFADAFNPGFAEDYCKSSS